MATWRAHQLRKRNTKIIIDPLDIVNLDYNNDRRMTVCLDITRCSLISKIISFYITNVLL